MKTAALFAIIAALAIVAGAYSATKQQADRVAWGAEHGRLSARIAALEHQVEEQSERLLEQPSDDDHPPKVLTAAIARLSSIEAEILQHRAELVQLKSDRLVADEHAKSSLEMLRRQVRKSTEIEQDLGALQSRKLQIKKHITNAEKQINELAGTIRARQEYAASLDQKIAELVVHQEAVSSRLSLAEREEASQAVASEDLEASKETAVAEPSVALAVSLDEDRSQGLYRFKNLTVQPGVGGPAPISEDQAKLAAKTDEAVDTQFAPDQWAAKQYDLARALVARGERNSGTTELKEAVLAFRAALGEWPRDGNVLRWAATQNDLGYALALLGQRQRDVSILEDAAIACRQALSEIRREKAPLLWATAQYNLGLTLGSMATVKDDEVLWRNAIKALQQSTEVFASGGAKAEANKSLIRLQDAHDRLTALKKSS